MVTFESVKRGGGRSRHAALQAVPSQVAREARPQVRSILHGQQIQPKLTIGPSDDEYEQEADRVADQVMRIPNTVSTTAGSGRLPIQRKCKECEEEERVQRTCGECELKVQRAPAKQGWSVEGLNKDVSTVGAKGEIQSGQKAATDMKGVWRVPIEGLGRGFLDPQLKPAEQGRAIVLIPNTVGPAAPKADENVPVDILLHLHGHGAGYRELQTGEKDAPEVLKPGQLRDVDLYQMEQQLLAHVEERAKANKPPLIAVLPQGSAKSGFGTVKKESDAYVKDVFATLSALKYLPDKAVPARLIVSGHSGGGPTAMAIAKQRRQARERTDVVLFDAINSSCTDKEPVTDARGNPKMECKKDSPCSSGEYDTVKDWVTNTITAEAKALNTEASADETQLPRLFEERGTRFRAFTSGHLNSSDTCSYGHWYGKLSKHIDATIAGLKLSGDIGTEIKRAVQKQLHEDYQVREVQGLGKEQRHERMIGQGNLATSLDELYDIPRKSQTKESTPEKPAPQEPAGQKPGSPTKGQRLQRAPEAVQAPDTATHSIPPRIQRQPEDAPAPPIDTPAVDPDEALIQAAVDFLAQRPAAKAFGLSKATINSLKDLLVHPRRIDDDALKSQLTALTAQRRAAIAEAAVARLQTQISERRAATLLDLADQFEQRIDTQLPVLAGIASAAEEEETKHLATLTPKERRKTKLRPQFPLILKYICRHLLFSQIDGPQIKPRTLDEQWAIPLGLTKTDVLFPEIYDEALVAQLKGLPKDVRAELKRMVADRTLGVVSDYIDERMGITPDTIRDEYALLTDITRSSIEGGIEGYFACRTGLLNKFGSPRDVPATIDAVNSYYGGLKPAEFLQQGPDPKPKGHQTLVHDDLKAALESAETKMKNSGWLPEVLSSVKTYWSTNIRENRNNITQLSEHSFGFAVDVNPDNNPNLARFGQANWNYINAMIGENVFSDPAGNRTEAVETIRAATDPTKTRTSIEKIRRQSDRLVNVFENEDNLRARLTEILKERDITLGHKIGIGPIRVAVGGAQQMQALLDHAKQAVSGPPKERAAHAKRLQETIVNELWSQNPLASGTTSLPLATELVKTLAPAVKTLAQADAKEAIITAQIRTPADKLPRNLGKQGIQGVFSRAVVIKLKAVPESDRATLAIEVMLGLRQPLAHKQIEIQGAEIAEFVKRGFAVLAGTRKPTGERIGGGGEVVNLAAQGFANLSPKFVMGMISADGGDLKWLGVHNQDMHHFELKNPPAVPRAVIKAEEPALAPVRPAPIGPSQAGGPEQDVSIE